MDLQEMLSQALSGGNVVALPLALAGGLVAGVNPCCLALYPAAAACCGVQQPRRAQTTGNAVAFVLGVAIAIAALGVLAAYLGHVAVMTSPVKYAIALLPILMGVRQFGWIRLPNLPLNGMRSGLGGAFGAGLLLSLIIGPCGTPMIASVLSFAAYKQSLIYGGLLLFAYGLGAGLPVVMFGTAAGAVLKYCDCSRFGRWIDPLIGSFLILLGFYLLWRI